MHCVDGLMDGLGWMGALFVAGMDGCTVLQEWMGGMCCWGG